MNTDDLTEESTDRGETVICACLHRTEAEVRGAVVRLGLETFEDVADAVLAGSGCTTCRPEVEAILDAVLQAGLQETGLQTVELAAQAHLAESVDGEREDTSAAGRTSPDQSSI